MGRIRQGASGRSRFRRVLIAALDGPVSSGVGVLRFPRQRAWRYRDGLKSFGQTLVLNSGWHVVDGQGGLQGRLRHATFGGPEPAEIVTGICVLSMET